MSDNRRRQLKRLAAVFALAVVTGVGKAAGAAVVVAVLPTVHGFLG
ncbi:hypothetical protein ABT124_37075 [Streptomyces sp. NPDC001982]